MSKIVGEKWSIAACLLFDDGTDPFDLDEYLARERRRNQIGRV